MPVTEQLNKDPDMRPHSVLASLEPDQLTAAKQRLRRRSLKGSEVFLLWSLRIYLLFMIVVVIYQLWFRTQ